MKVNQATIDLVKRWEGLRLEAYRDPVGIWTIGYGHSTKAGYGPVPGPGMTMTQAEAEQLLGEGLDRFARQVAPLLTREPTANQFGAMVSLAYNIGVGAFSRSTCLKRFNAGDIEGAAEALTWFNKAGGKVLRGLVNRREEERTLFLSEPAQPAPVTPDAEKPLTKSTTNWAAGGVGVTTVGGALGFIGQLDPMAQMVLIGGVLVVGALLAWIVRERIKKKAQGW